MRIALCALVAASLAFGAEKTAAEKPRVPRTALASMEKVFDMRIARTTAMDTFELLGTSRGVYLETYGVVFSAEVNLTPDPWRLPMQPALTPAEKQALNARKRERVPLLKQMMREMLVNAATALDMVPANEQIVFAMSLFYRSFEKRDGLPDQIVMQAPRQVLLDMQAKKPDTGEIRVEEY